MVKCIFNMYFLLEERDDPFVVLGFFLLEKIAPSLVVCKGHLRPSCFRSSSTFMQIYWQFCLFVQKEILLSASKADFEMEANHISKNSQLYSLAKSNTLLISLLLSLTLKQSRADILKRYCLPVCVCVCLRNRLRTIAKCRTKLKIQNFGDGNKEWIYTIKICQIISVQ